MKSKAARAEAEAEEVERHTTRTHSSPKTYEVTIFIKPGRDSSHAANRYAMTPKRPRYLRRNTTYSTS